MAFSVVVSVMIASFLSPMSTSLAALATPGRIERGAISDMAVAGDDQNLGFSGELVDRLSLVFSGVMWTCQVSFIWHVSWFPIFLPFCFPPLARSLA